MSEPATKTRRNKSIIAWLAVALLLHALLLLIPLKLAQIQINPAPLIEVQLTRVPVRTLEETIEASVQSPNGPQPEPPLLQNEAMIPVEPTPLDLLPAKPLAVADEEETPVPTTATLFQSVRNLEFGRPEMSSSRQLGTHREHTLPANWKAGAGAEALVPEANRFSEMFAPAEVEIVDRWLSADGSHNVVVNLPNGETVCGRAQAWDPMQPLVEHLMMFRGCGGGGKRTFDMNIPETPRDGLIK